MSSPSGPIIKLCSGQFKSRPGPHDRVWCRQWGPKGTAQFVTVMSRLTQRPDVTHSALSHNRPTHTTTKLETLEMWIVLIQIISLTPWIMFSSYWSVGLKGGGILSQQNLLIAYTSHPPILLCVCYHPVPVLALLTVTLTGTAAISQDPPPPISRFKTQPPLRL